jgi:hypothetical protein
MRLITIEFQQCAMIQILDHMVVMVLLLIDLLMIGDGMASADPFKLAVSLPPNIRRDGVVPFDISYATRLPQQFPSCRQVRLK